MTAPPRSSAPRFVVLGTAVLDRATRSPGTDNAVPGAAAGPGAGARNDWAHKQSTTIIRDNQAVFVEDLCVTGLARTRLAKSVHDAGWSMFTRMLEEKAARYGRYFAKVDRFYPSSRLCSEGIPVVHGREDVNEQPGPGWVGSGPRRVDRRRNTARSDVEE